MLISKVLVAHGYTDNVPLPDITTKEKAQQYIGLDMAVEKADKDKFLKEIVPEWLQRLRQKGFCELEFIFNYICPQNKSCTQKSASPFA